MTPQLKLLENDPQVGDVLMYRAHPHENEMIVLIVRRMTNDICCVELCDVDVLWLSSDRINNLTTHYGGFNSWKGWYKL